MIYRLKYVGFAVDDVSRTRRLFMDLLGLESRHLGANRLIGADNTATVPFPNQCSLYLMESTEAGSAVHRYLAEKGPGLERIGLLSDDIVGEYERVIRAGVPLGATALAEGPFGRQFTVPAHYVSGIAVDIIEPHRVDELAPHYNSDASGVLGLQHIGVAVGSFVEAIVQFQSLFDLEMRNVRTDQHEGEQKDGMIEPGNDRLWLHITESWGPNARVRSFLETKGPGLEHLCIEVADIRVAVNRVSEHDAPIWEHKIFTNREDGFEAFIYPEHTSGVTIELIEPYPTSRGYRPNADASPRRLRADSRPPRC